MVAGAVVTGAVDAGTVFAGAVVAGTMVAGAVVAGVMFRTVPVALTGAAQLRANGISSCCTVYTTIRLELRHSRKTWPRTLVDPCLLSDDNHRLA